MGDTSSPSFLSKYMADGGLVILSRFPIVSHSFNVFRYGVVSDSLAQKGLLYAKIKVRNAFLHVFTAHTQASYFDIGESSFIASFKTRMDQIQQINKIVLKILFSEYNKICDKVFLVGDMNVDALSYMHKPPNFPMCEELISSEYEEMINSLNDNGLVVKNFFHDLYKNHPITYADTNTEGHYKEIVLTNTEDLGTKLCLDYIFEIFYEEDEKLNSKKMLTMGDKVFVENFLVKEFDHFDPSDRAYTQLSDHYGLSFSIIYEEKKIMKMMLC